MNCKITGVSRRRMAGVTLLELMIVVVVVGILGMIALPSYRQYVMRAQRTEAKAALLQLATIQERYYLAARTYGTIAQLQAAVPPLLPNPARSERGLYALTLDNVTTQGYTATATPISGGAADLTGDAQCATFTLTAQGQRGATGTGAANCW
jgi:type IV pilus assembly protein PilE